MGVILAFATGAGAGTSPPQNHVDGWGIDLEMITHQIHAQNQRTLCLPLEGRPSFRPRLLRWTWSTTFQPTDLEVPINYA